MRLLVRWLLSAGTLMAIAYYLVPGVTVQNFYAALMAALLLGLINALIRPIILFFTLPINVMTLGLFTLVVNALLFWFVGTVVQGFAVQGFWAAFWGSLILWMANWAISVFLRD